jgi:hypothetical protein
VLTSADKTTHRRHTRPVQLQLQPSRCSFSLQIRPSPPKYGLKHPQGAFASSIAPILLLLASLGRPTTSSRPFQAHDQQIFHRCAPNQYHLSPSHHSSFVLPLNPPGRGPWDFRQLISAKEQADLGHSAGSKLRVSPRRPLLSLLAHHLFQILPSPPRVPLPSSLEPTSNSFLFPSRSSFSSRLSPSIAILACQIPFSLFHSSLERSYTRLFRFGQSLLLPFK